MNTEIENRVIQALRELADEGYREFQSSLIPNIAKENVIGVRTPVLRRFSAEFAKSADVTAFLAALPHRYLDENNLHAFLIERMTDFDKVKAALDRFLPYVDNWAVCDGMNPKILAKHPKRRVEAAMAWLSSSHVYTVRYGIVILMKYDLGDTFRPEYLARVASLTFDDYYVRMAQAWYFATALATQYDETLPYLTEHRLTPWVHNKTVQKAIESYRIPPERKAYLKTLRRSSPHA